MSPVRRAHDRARGDHRHRQHRRRRDRGRGGRAGRRAVDVAHRRLRHRDQVRRGAALGEVPGHHRRRHDGRRSDVRARARHAEPAARRSSFAALTAISAFGIGNTVQANSIATLVHDTFGVSTWITGAVMTALTALVILGGIQSIAAVCEWLVPFMAIFYVAGCLIILAMHAATIPDDRRADRELGLHRPGGGRRLPRRRRARGDALRRRARPLLERVGARQRADRGRGGADQEPRAPGAGRRRTGTFWDTVVVCAMTGPRRRATRASGGRA